MGEILFWLLAASGLCLLVAWPVLRRRAARRAHEARMAAARAEAERAAAARSDAEQQVQQERLLAAERAEVRRRAELQAEAERIAAERAAAERAEALRLKDERLEAERLEAQRLAAEHAAAEHAATERAAAERAEAERLEAQRLEAERIQAERIQAERLEAERFEAERFEAERLVAARRAAEQAEVARLAALQAERDAAAQAEQQAEAQRLEAERSAAAAVPLAVKSAAQTLVLVADDSKVVRIKTGRLLAQHQYQVAYASDGLDAVQQMQAQAPDVLITDVEMPGMDGFELTRHIRADPRTAGLPVIMITAADDRHREQANAAGVSVLLGKPYPEDALLEHIRLAMGQPAAPALDSSRHSLHDALA